MNLFNSLKISASGLSAERLRMDVISANIANANTTRSPQGGPYRRQVALLSPGMYNTNNFKKTLQNAMQNNFPYSGVRVEKIVTDPTPNKRVYDPKHPDASADGYVEYPNVDVMKEIVELITASRAYEANVTTLNATKNMALKTLEIGRG
ncbi:MAG: flagellar basal body rod protein FlgC [Bacillota bacterium]|jgi:flagellar basal-body rod protein FlgC|nr:flgC [Peptococcaceae bacterium]